jgi:hypothetical protein
LIIQLIIVFLLDSGIPLCDNLLANSSELIIIVGKLAY